MRLDYQWLLRANALSFIAGSGGLVPIIGRRFPSIAVFAHVCVQNDLRLMTKRKSWLLFSKVTYVTKIIRDATLEVWSLELAQVPQFVFSTLRLKLCLLCQLKDACQAVE